MCESRLRLRNCVAVGDEAEAVKYLGIGIEVWIFHHGPLRDANPVLGGDMSPIGEGVWGQDASEDRHFIGIYMYEREHSDGS